MNNNTKTTVIYHRADFDGIFCREIARKFMPDAELIGWDYGDAKIPLPDGAFYILDLSPESVESVPESLAENDPDVLSRFVWIDHHKSAITAFDNPSIKGIRIDGVAACRLAWQWFTKFEAFQNRYGNDTPILSDYVERRVGEPEAVRLAGEYDIWDKRDPNAETFQFGLRSTDLQMHWLELLSMGRHPSISEIEALMDVGHKPDLRPDGTMVPPIINTLLSNGTLLQRYQREQDASVVKRGFDVEFEGRKFLALNIARCNSLTFESAAKPEHDGLMGFYWNGNEWVVSLYHTPQRKDIDLSQIAAKYGGGGHRGACGFRTNRLSFIP